MAWKPILNFLLGAACCQGAVVVSDWPQFRGPNNSGVSSQSQAPSQWSDTKNLAWSQKIPGYGWSCPVVLGDKVFVTTAVSDKQTKPSGGFGGGGFGGPGGFGRERKPPDAMYKWEGCCLTTAEISGANCFISPEFVRLAAER